MDYSQLAIITTIDIYIMLIGLRSNARGTDVRVFSTRLNYSMVGRDGEFGRALELKCYCFTAQ